MTNNDDYRDELEELYNRELMHDRRELPAGGLELVDRASSCASIVLEACNAELLAAPLRRHHVRAELVAPAQWHGFPWFRYSGTVAGLVGFLGEQYDDGGDDFDPLVLLALALELEGVSS